MTPIRLIAADMDGTLLDSRSRLPAGIFLAPASRTPAPAGRFGFAETGGRRPPSPPAAGCPAGAGAGMRQGPGHLLPESPDFMRIVHCLPGGIMVY